MVHEEPSLPGLQGPQLVVQAFVGVCAAAPQDSVASPRIDVSALATANVKAKVQVDEAAGASQRSSSRPPASIPQSGIDTTSGTADAHRSRSVVFERPRQETPERTVRQVCSPSSPLGPTVCGRLDGAYQGCSPCTDRDWFLSSAVLHTPPTHESCRIEFSLWRSSISIPGHLAAQSLYRIHYPTIKQRHLEVHTNPGRYARRRLIGLGRERTRSVLGVFAVARDLRVMLRVPVVQVEVATCLEEERDLAGTQLVALALDHLRGPANTFGHSWTTSFLRPPMLARIRPYVIRCIVSNLIGGVLMVERIGTES